jgi:hypothetical protein
MAGRYRIAVIISVFQTDDAGSTPATCSKKTPGYVRVFFCFVVCKRVYGKAEIKAFRA